uniref:Uncharacterized protein n=1 Tax=Arundo donax TaxID=35708 RepID=A0A0A9A449_ARUDO
MVQQKEDQKLKEHNALVKINHIFASQKFRSK